MEKIDSTRVHDAVVVLMNIDGKVSELRSLLLEQGVTPRELEIAQSLATRNLFHFTFCRKWDATGEVHMVPEVIGEA